MKSISLIIVVLSFLVTQASSAEAIQGQMASAEGVSDESGLSDIEIKALKSIIPMSPCPSGKFPKFAIEYGEEGNVTVSKNCTK